MKYKQYYTKSSSDGDLGRMGGIVRVVPPFQWPRWLGYAAAVVLEGLLTLAQLAILPYFPLPSYPILYVLVIMLVAYMFGEGPAVLAFVLGFLLYDYFFVPPVRTLLPHEVSLSAWAGLVAFLVGTLIVSVSMVLIRRHKRRIESLLVQIENELYERKRAEEALRKAEAHQLEFYRRTIMAATAGKLVITDEREIESIAGPTLDSWEIHHPAEIKGIRHNIIEIARTQGMDEDKIQQFILCVGEATTNAIKHAGCGTASVHLTRDSMIVVVADKGPGIEALNLPDVALVPGYSSAGTLGMGYKAMIAFADRVYLATDPNGTTVALEMKFQRIESSPFSVSFDYDGVCSPR